MSVQIENLPKIIIIGMSHVGKELLEALTKGWHVIAIDLDEKKLRDVKRKYKESVLTTIVGDACSYIVLQSASVNKSLQICISVNNDTVAYEIASILKKRFYVKHVVVHLQTSNLEKSITDLGYNTVVDTDITVKSIINHTALGHSIALYVGKGEGEIIQCILTPSSPIINRKLKSLPKSKEWIIGAIYRSSRRSTKGGKNESFIRKLNISKDEKLIIPNGDTIPKAGDKVLLIGDPNVLQSTVQYLKVGNPKFPIKYGKICLILPLDFDTFLHLLPSIEAILDKIYISELNTLFGELEIPKGKTKPYQFIKAEVQKVQFKNSFFHNIFTLRSSIQANYSMTALLLLQKPQQWFKRIIFNRVLLPLSFSSFRGTQTPCWVLQNPSSITDIVLFLNPQESTFQVAELCFELALCFKLPVHIIQVQQPSLLMGAENEKYTEELLQFAHELGALYGIDINVNILEGNPIRETLRTVKKKQLLIFSYSRKNIMDILIPNIGKEIQRKFKGNMLILIE